MYYCSNKVLNHWILGQTNKEQESAKVLQNKCVTLTTADRVANGEQQNKNENNVSDTVERFNIFLGTLFSHDTQCIYFKIFL